MRVDNDEKALIQDQGGADETSTTPHEFITDLETHISKSVKRDVRNKNKPADDDLQADQGDQWLEGPMVSIFSAALQKRKHD